MPGPLSDVQPAGEALWDASYTGGGGGRGCGHRELRERVTQAGEGCGLARGAGSQGIVT